LIRESKSADEIASVVNDSVRGVPGLKRLKVEVARLRKPDVHGCNWIAHYPSLPVGCSAESERLLKDIIRNAQHNFNLWEVH